MTGAVRKAHKNIVVIMLAFTLLISGCVTKVSGLDAAYEEFEINQISQFWVDEDIWADSYAEELFLDSRLFNIFGMEATAMTSAGASFQIPMPTASGTSVAENELSAIDYSNANDGYVMIKYPLFAGDVVIVLVQGPKSMISYIFPTNGEFEILPLTEGNGEYKVMLGERTPEGKFAAFNVATFNAVIGDPFAPFLRPNRLVNYTLSSKAVVKAQELIGGQTDLIERIKTVFEFVVNHFEYDYPLAAGPPEGYVPDLDYIYDYGKAICYGYASTMAAMLRSQGIITRLVFGFMSDGQFHAWVDVYSDTDGWLSGIIFFDGTGWSMVDPTVVSTGGETGEKYSMNPANYVVKNVY